MTASLHVLPVQLPDVVAMLRRLADQIESGDYGQVCETVVITSGERFEVFGFGTCDGTTAHYMMAKGMSKLQGCVNRYHEWEAE